MPAWWRAAPASRPARRSTARRLMLATCHAPAAAGPMPVVRSAAKPSTAAAVASGGSIKPGEALHRETRGARCRRRTPRRAVPLHQNRCRWRARPRGPRCRHGGERRRDQAQRSAARPSTAATVASGVGPVHPSYPRQHAADLHCGPLAVAEVAKRATARAVDLALIIAEILAAGRVSLHCIAAALNERGISTPRGHGEWSTVQVSRVLERIRQRPR
jgi:hypothetical protein